MVENSAASPASTRMVRSPSRSTTVPDRTVNQSRPGCTRSSSGAGRAGDAHLGHGHAVRPGSRVSIQVVTPRASSRCGRITTSLVVGGLDQLVERGAERAGDRGQLVEGDPPVAGLDPAQRGRAQVAAGRQVVERPARGPARSPRIRWRTSASRSPSCVIRKMLCQKRKPSVRSEHGHTITTTHQHHPEHDRRGDLAELLDLDAEVLHAYLAEVTGWVDELRRRPPRRILDLGAGTGTGTLALARRFAGGRRHRRRRVRADAGPPAATRPAQLGVADRVRTVQADLDAALAGVDPVDLVWASNSLHHLADPDRVLRRRPRRAAPGRAAGRGRDGLVPALPARRPRRPASKRAATPPWPRAWPTSCRTSAPTGARG